MASLTVCIFSFNRGAYLRNCVESVRCCTPGANIVIFDDNSDDPETLAYLEKAAEICRVVAPREVGTIKHGGLYHNMNAALDLLGGEPLLCFLQDDTQLVRPISSSELKQIDELFERNPGLGFVHPCFIRGIDLRKRSVTPLAGPASGFFYRQDAGQSAGIHYSDLVIFKPRRLVAHDWYFHQSEPANDRQAKDLFGLMAYMWLPFAMWLPEVPAYRGKNKTLGLRLAERKKQVGFFSFRLMPSDSIATARSAVGKHLPIAEDWLECDPYDPPKPWTYNPLTGLRLYKQLNNAEVAIRRWFRQLVRQR